MRCVFWSSFSTIYFQRFRKIIGLLHRHFPVRLSLAFLKIFISFNKSSNFVLLQFLIDLVEKQFFHFLLKYSLKKFWNKPKYNCFFINFIRNLCYKGITLPNNLIRPKVTKFCSTAKIYITIRWKSCEYLHTYQSRDKIFRGVHCTKNEVFH